MSKFGQRIRAITLSGIFLLLPACQIITEQADKNESYGEYYLALQQLSEQQLSQEVLKQQASIDSEATAQLLKALTISKLSYSSFIVCPHRLFIIVSTLKLC